MSAASIFWGQAREHVLAAIASVAQEGKPETVALLREAMADIERLKCEVTAHEDFTNPEHRRKLDTLYAGKHFVEEAGNARKAIRKARRRVDAMYAEEDNLTANYAEGANALYWAEFWIDSILHQAKKLPPPPSRATVSEEARS